MRYKVYLIKPLFSTDMLLSVCLHCSKGLFEVMVSHSGSKKCSKRSNI